MSFRERFSLQGMGFVGAALLMHMGEEDAFCSLTFLMYRCGLRGVFLPDMQQLQLRLYQFSQLMMDCLPRLHKHLEELDIKPVMYAADWFLTLFARTLPLHLVFRVFDIVIGAVGNGGNGVRGRVGGDGEWRVQVDLNLDLNLSWS